MKKVKAKKVLARDLTIAKSATMELNLGTRTIKSKKIYDRKRINKNFY